MEKIINKLIKLLKVDTNKISDGYHTFGELYDHRCRLFIKLASVSKDSWKSLRHSDGSSWDGWFIMGIGKKAGEQITYHLPMKFWDSSKWVFEIDTAPEWDGHTPSDVLERLSI